ncbi:MAG: hypothetical protein N2662_04060 [Bacteroidales bacterium]|nr:hypothetical protein [Bacteroidales bacterium]
MRIQRRNNIICILKQRAVLCTILLLIGVRLLGQQSFQQYLLNQAGEGQQLKITVEKGKEYGHPVIAIWLTTPDGKYLQTLYVSETVGKGVYPHGKAHEGKWLPGEKRNPATLPYWAYSRGVIAPDSLYLPTSDYPILDAYTGATPAGSFIIQTRLDTVLTGKATLLFEINKPFDFNDFWHNTLFPDNQAYKSSGQPSVVYAVTIDMSNPDNPYFLNPIGHGDPAGKSGKLYTDLSTLTSALKIISKIKVEIF